MPATLTLNACDVSPGLPINFLRALKHAPATYVRANVAFVRFPADGDSVSARGALHVIHEWGGAVRIVVTVSERCGTDVSVLVVGGATSTRIPGTTIINPGIVIFVFGNVLVVLVDCNLSCRYVSNAQGRIERWLKPSVQVCK